MRGLAFGASSDGWLMQDAHLWEAFYRLRRLTLYDFAREEPIR